MKQIYFFLLLFIATFAYTNVLAQNFPPPRNLQFDSVTLKATWDPPISILLNENFESNTFPPANWQATSQGVGWISAIDASSPGLTIPSHTVYAAVNNDLNGLSNNGCCDYLITPQLDLTQYESYSLTFNSFFRGWDAETASVKISTNGGVTWITLLDVLPHFTWASLKVDLSAYSGVTGSNQVLLAFVANDQGNQAATGWAIDDVQVSSLAIPVAGYAAGIDGTVINYVSDTTFTYTYSFTDFSFSTNHLICILAFPTIQLNYSGICKNVTSFNLPAPKHLVATANVNAAILTWDAATPGDSPAGTTPDYSGIIGTGILKSVGQHSNMDPDGGYTATMDAAATESEIKYCGASNSSIGTGAAADFMVAARFTPAELATYYGSKQLTKIKIQLAATNTWSAVIAKVWKGGSATNAGNEVFSKDITADIVLGYYTTITLPTPILLEAGNEYWIGYEVITTGGWPAGCDAGPMVDGKGNMMYFGGVWTTLYTLAPTLTFNWNIIGVIDDAGSQPLANLVSYVIYRDGVPIAEVPKTMLNYWDLNVMPQTYCYDITAKYDLSPYGVAYAGLYGQSIKVGHPCVCLVISCCFPLIENWTSGQFDVNQWTPGANWVIDGTLGNPLPTAKFKSQPLLTNYSSKLVSLIENTTLITTTTPYCIYLDFDYLLKDNSASGSEKLTIEVWNGGDWIPVKEFANNGDKGWTKEHINITSNAINSYLRVRFNANGTNSELINYWLVDNIAIYVQYGFQPPTNLTAVNAGNNQTNDIQLNWTSPVIGNMIELIEDDSTWENSLALNPGYNGWLGNKFSCDFGRIKSLDVQWLNNSQNEGNLIHIDIFDINHRLLGSSPAFIPVAAGWQNILLPNIEIKGDFYAMVRFDDQLGFTHFLGMDSTTYSGRPNNGWYYDGINWSKMDTFGFDEGVFSIHANVYQVTDCENNPVTLKHHNNYATGNTADSDGKVFKSNSGTDALTNYTIFRRTYEIQPNNQDSIYTPWQTIATATTNSYLDHNLDYKCYQYYVKAAYTEGVSLPSNIAGTCFLVGVKSAQARGVKLYPNPAIDKLTLEMSSPFDNVMIFNSSGVKLMDESIKGKAEIMIDVSHFSQGIYNLKCTNAKGEASSIRFVKLK